MTMKYQVQGSGPAVLFVHGLPTSGRLWDFVMRALQAQFRCIAVDLPGFGGSPPFEDGSLDADRYADALEELRKQLSISHWHLVGHDAGSTIAVHYAGRFGKSLDRLVLCSPPIFPEHQIPWFFRLLRSPIIGDVLAPVATELVWRVGLPKALGQVDGMTDIIEDFRQPFSGFQGSRRLLHILRWGDPAQVLRKTAAMLSSIAAPTLIVHGKQDTAIPISFATRAAEIMPKAELHLIEAKHFIPLICPEELCKHLLLFLAEDGAAITSG